MEKRAPFSVGVRPAAGVTRQEGGRARAAMSPFPQEVDKKCDFYSDKGRCRGFKSKGTPYCVGHAKSLGVTDGNVSDD